ncbi:MAG TPA: ATP-binding protein [Acidimicrobiales bacterium]|nr:ATP-binding protein [Acidimicrobiales bacterium]
MTALAVLLGALLVAALVAGSAVVRRLQAAQRRVRELEARLDREHELKAESAQASRRLRRALGAIAHGVVIFDEHGEVVYRNNPATSFLAARHGDALVEEAISALARIALGGRETEHEVEVFGPPRRTLNLRAVPLGGEAAPAGALVVVEDTSARRRLENVRRDFVANISHELKTPVGALALLAETLLGEDEPDVMRRLAERITSEAFRVAHTIDDLLELSRLEASPAKSEELLPVAVFVAEAVDRVRSAAERRGIVLEVEEVPEKLTVQGERRQLVSAVVNLLDNAVKYSEPDSSIEVRACTDGEWVEVEVRDHGIGIPQRDLERIFERFYRVDRARSRETGGTGLGLAIVRHVASNHRGDVHVESREGEGSRFTLRLPARADVAVHSANEETG